MATPQSALERQPSWLDILIGTGVQAQAAQQADALAGRNLQKAGITGYLEQDGGYLSTLARDQFDALLAEADRGYALDVARFGLAQADLNYRQRAAEAQDRMQQMALQVAQRGPANAIGYNYLLNNRNAPAGTEKPYGGANISQPANIQVPTPAATPPPAAPSIPKKPVEFPLIYGAPGALPAAGPGPNGESPLTRPGTPSWAVNPPPGMFTPPAAAPAPAPVATAPPPANLSNPDRWNEWMAQFPKMAHGGFLDSLGPQQAATAMVGDSPNGMPTGHEEMATATVTPDGQPRLIVAPTNGQPPDPQSPEFQRGLADAQAGTIDQASMQDPDYAAGVASFQQQGGGGGFLDQMSTEQMPRMAAGGVVDVPSYVGGRGQSGGTANTAYSQQDIANLPVVKQATGQERVSRFGAFAGDTTIPSTDTKLPSGAEFRIDQYADMLPSSRALLESIVSTPREMGGLGLDFQDYLESSRRAAPIGRRFGPAAYGS